MAGEIDGVRQAITDTGWHHWVPFAALMVRDAAPPNRPMATRLVEQTLVAVLAGGGATYATLQINQARHEEQIKALSTVQTIQIQALHDQLRDSEIRLTAQIVELRARQLK